MAWKSCIPASCDLCSNFNPNYYFFLVLVRTYIRAYPFTFMRACLFVCAHIEVMLGHEFKIHTYSRQQKRTRKTTGCQRANLLSCLSSKERRNWNGMRSELRILKKEPLLLASSKQEASRIDALCLHLQKEVYKFSCLKVV